MTYKELLVKLLQIPLEELDHEVVFFDSDNFQFTPVEGIATLEREEIVKVNYL